MSWSWVQGNSAKALASSTCSVTLASPPTPGNVICVVLGVSNSTTIAVVQDGNSNSYQAVVSTAKSVNNCRGFYLIVPSNGNTTITASNMNPSFNSAIFADEFSFGGAPFYFFADGQRQTPGTNFNGIVVPSLNLLRVGSLLYSGIKAGVSGLVTGVASPWTQSGGVIQNATSLSVVSEYLLDAPAGVTNPNYVNGSVGDDNWVVEFAFSYFVEESTPGAMDEYQWLGGDYY